MKNVRQCGSGRPRAAIVVVALALALVGSTSAESTATAADDGARAQASALRQEGNTAMQSGRPADALAMYAQAYALHPDPALLYNLGRAQQALADYPAALSLLERFEREADLELKHRVAGLDRLLAELRARVATVTLRANVDGATVRLNDKLLGRTPFRAPLRVNAGDGRLDITAEGYLPFKRDVTLEGGQSTSLDVHLDSKETHGVMLIRSPEPSVSVLVDGRLRGMAPVEVRLAAGQHRLELRKEGFQSVSTTVVLEAGKPRNLSIELEAEPKIYQRWWFWTGVGIAAAGAVTAVIIYGKEKDPDVGTIPPGKIAGGLSF